MAKTKKAVSSASAGKAAKKAAPKTAKKAASKKPLSKKAAIKKTATAVKKASTKKPCARKAAAKIDREDTDRIPPIRPGKSDNPWNVPDDVAKLFVAFFDDNGKIGKNYLAAVKGLSDKSAGEIMQSLDWESNAGETSLAYLSKKLRLNEEDIKCVKAGRTVKQFRFKDLLGGSVFKTNPLTDEEIEKIVDELMERLFECCRCCRCWPCRPYPFCRRCFKHKCLVEIGPVGVNFPHVHRLNFTGAAAVTASGMDATVNLGAGGAGAYSQAQTDGLLTAHKASGDHDGRYYPKPQVDTLLNNHAANAAAGHPHAFGTAANTYAEGNHVHSFGTAAGEYAEGDHLHTGTYEPAFAKNAAFNKDFGTSAGEVAEGDHVHTFGTAAGEYAEGDHNHDARYLQQAQVTGDIATHSASGAHDGRYHTKTEIGDMFVADTGAAGDTQGTCLPPDDRYYTKRSIDTALSSHASNNGNAHTFGIATGEFAEGDHSHENFGAAPNWTPAYARKFFFDQVANPALSPNGTSGTIPGEVQICIADSQSMRERYQAMQAGGITPQVTVKGYAFEPSVTPFELTIGTPTIFQGATEYYIRFTISKGASIYNPIASAWLARLCLITYCIFD